ncbi:MAG: hypothetical protein NVS3B20_19850 [Polyangiales bacterium]
MLASVLAGCGTEDVAPLKGDDATQETTTDGSAESASETLDEVASDALDALDSSHASNDGGDAADAQDAKDVGSDATTEVACLPTTAMDAYFTLAAGINKCVVAQYTVDAGGLAALTWGRHGGPLGFEVKAAVPTVVRYQVPGTATGALTVVKQPLIVPGVPPMVFWNAQAVDLPFFSWTAIGYTGSGAGFPGELVLADTTKTPAPITRYNVNGFFSAGAIGLAGSSGGRLLYTGLSALSNASSTTNEGGFYAADSCGSVATTPRLLPGTDGSCKAPIKIATWEGGPGRRPPP